MTKIKFASTDPVHMATPGEAKEEYEKLASVFGKVMADIGPGATNFDLARHFARHPDELGPEELVGLILVIWQIEAHDHGTSIDKPESLEILAVLLKGVLCGIRSGTIAATFAKISDPVEGLSGRLKVPEKIQRVFTEVADMLDMKSKQEREERAKGDEAKEAKV